MAKNKNVAPPGNDEKPAWQQAQQKETTTKNSEEHLTPAKSAKPVKVKMLTDYRDVAKAGEVWTTDAEKAEELVKLGRAEYV